MAMHKDEAMQIAFNASTMLMDDLIHAYRAFVLQTENTPMHFGDSFIAQGAPAGRSRGWQRGLHGAIGLSTEAAEILDAYKKDMYGKNRPLSPLNIKEECGDALYYLTLLLDAYGLTLRDVVQDNVIKLANRYIEKFDVA